MERSQYWLEGNGDDSLVNASGETLQGQLLKDDCQSPESGPEMRTKRTLESPWILECGPSPHALKFVSRAYVSPVCVQSLAPTTLQKFALLMLNAAGAVPEDSWGLRSDARTLKLTDRHGPNGTFCL